MADGGRDSRARASPPPAELSAQQPAQLVEELSRSNAAIKAENELFERFISRLNPKDLEPLAPTEPSIGMSQTEVSQVRSRSKSKSRSFTSEHLVQLTVEQKCYIAQQELEEMNKDLKRLHEGSERVIGNYKATIEEADMRLGEIKKAQYEFDREIAKPLREKKGVMMGAEKVNRYFEDRTRAKETLAEKLRLKNAALRVQKKKLQMQLKQKEEMDEALHEVDFQQLKIENSQYLEKIDERNQGLLNFKLLAGNALQVLNSYKKKLQNASYESSQLDSEISAQNEVLGKIESESLQAEEERAKAEAENQRLHSQLSEYHVPDVLEYVKCKASHRELEQGVRVWERKVEIAEMALQTHLKSWNRLKASSDP